MSQQKLRRLLLIGLMLFILALGAPMVLAQDDAPPPEGETPPEGEVPPPVDPDAWCAAVDETPYGCISLALNSDAMIADYYIGETLMAAGVNPGQFVVAPDQTHRVEVRNIQSTEENFGNLFVYADTSANVYVYEGRISRSTAYPRKTYIRGTLNLTCDIRSVKEGDIVACQVIIDDIPQELTLAAGEKANYVLDPGEHTLTINLVGETADLWAPLTRTEISSITAGRTAYVRSRFDKRGKLTLALSESEGILADFYVNGELVATQVSSYEAWVEPNKTYRATAVNITDVNAAGVYRWYDGTGSTYISPGAERTITFRMRKEFLLGFIDVKCDPPNVSEGDIIGCRVTIDDILQEGDLPPGTTTTYTVDKGRRAVKVELVGESAFLWGPALHEQTVTVSAGRTARVSPRYAKSAHLFMNLSEEGVIADWYVDDVLVASQVAAFDVYVDPNKTHRVEALNIVDLAANGEWTWTGTAKSVYTSASRDYTATISLTKTILVGYIEISCEIENPPPDFPIYCQPYIDGVAVEGIAPNASATYAVAPGTHNVHVVLGPEWAWIGDPWDFVVDVALGETVTVRARYRII